LICHETIFLFLLVEKAIIFFSRKVWLQFHSFEVYDILSKKQS
jgi:hypothetical protein